MSAPGRARGLLVRVQPPPIVLGRSSRKAVRPGDGGCGGPDGKGPSWNGSEPMEKAGVGGQSAHSDEAPGGAGEADVSRPGPRR